MMGSVWDRKPGTNMQRQRSPGEFRDMSDSGKLGRADESSDVKGI